MIFSLYIFFFLVPFFSGGPAHGNQIVEHTLQDIASVMRSSLKEENCVCKSPLVSPLSALSGLPNILSLLALIQLQSRIFSSLNNHVFHMQGLIGDVRFEGCKKFVCEKDGWNESPARLFDNSNWIIFYLTILGNCAVPT